MDGRWTVQVERRAVLVQRRWEDTAALSKLSLAVLIEHWGTEYCDAPARDEHELYLTVEKIDHSWATFKSVTNAIVEGFHGAG
jgi:hypothetical protein